MEISENPKILIVDDRPENLLSMEILLEDEPYDIMTASSGNEALAHIINHDFALVLLDVQMPEIDGFETAELMRGNNCTKHVPIIFVTAINKDKKYIFKGYESGAVDYLFKPLEPKILKNKINVFLDLYKQKKIIENKNNQLNEANKTILEQQTKLIEEERIKVLLQMAGATAHELNQPLISLLNTIELLKAGGRSSENIPQYIDSIEESGKHITDIIKRIQFFGHDQGQTSSDKNNVVAIHQKLNIFWLEDDDKCFSAFNRLLSRKPMSTVTRAINIQDAKKLLLSENNYDLALLDYSLPDGNALELLDYMRGKEIKLPILILTGHGDEEIAANCIQAGAHGYLPKVQITKENFHQGISRVSEKFRIDRELETAREKIADMAIRDSLTGLYNRRYMEDVFDGEFKRSDRYGSDLSCLLFDLDYFKKINDTYGHACGDFVLKEFSKNLEQSTRDSDYTFRYGGEEFMLLLPQSNSTDAAKVAEKIRAFSESKEYVFQDHTLHVTVSIGIASLSDCLPKKASDMLTFADEALYRAKADGRNCVRIYKI